MVEGLRDIIQSAIIQQSIGKLLNIIKRASESLINKERHDNPPALNLKIKQLQSQKAVKHFQSSFQHNRAAVLAEKQT